MIEITGISEYLDSLCDHSELDDRGTAFNPETGEQWPLITCKKCWKIITTGPNERDPIQ